MGFNSFVKRLLSIAFSKGAYRCLFFFTLISALGFTLSTQMEMFSLGIVTRKGPDFFELFGVGTHPSTVSYSEVQGRWNELDKDGTGDYRLVGSSENVSEASPK